jgi:hypothetical protein
MTEEPHDKEKVSLEKLLIDNPSDFRFHAAYLTYSDIFDKATSPETKGQLNQSLVALQQNEIDHQTFYENINRFRGGEGSQFRFERSFIKTQKKREWRRSAQKQERISRHKK